MAIILVESGMSIQAAVDLVQPGDIVLVKNGVYHEQVNVDNKNYIRIIAKGDRVILDGQKSRDNGFRVSDSEGVEISGFTIRNYVFDGIEAIGGGYHRFLQNKISKIGFDGIFLVGDSVGNLVWKNEISSVGFEGILVVSQNNWIIENKTYKNQTGIFIDEDNNAVIGNKSFKNTLTGFVTTSVNTLLLGNDLFTNEDFGVFINNTFNTVALNNRINHNRGDGILNLDSQNTFAAENRVDKNSAKGIDLSGGYNILESNKVVDNRHDGLRLEADALANSLIGNRLENNKNYDLKILNLYNNNLLENSCCKSKPSQLCKHCK